MTQKKPCCEKHAQTGYCSDKCRCAECRETERNDREDAAILAEIRADYPNAADWHMPLIGGRRVAILDAAGNQIAVISDDDLTRYMNLAEGFYSFTFKGRKS